MYITEDYQHRQVFGFSDDITCFLFLRVRKNNSFTRTLMWGDWTARNVYYATRSSKL